MFNLYSPTPPLPRPPLIHVSEFINDINADGPAAFFFAPPSPPFAPHPYPPPPGRTTRELPPPHTAFSGLLSHPHSWHFHAPPPPRPTRRIALPLLRLLLFLLLPTSG